MNEVKSLTGPYWYTYTEALLTSLVVGFAENYFAAFSIENGMSAIQSGILVSLPLLFAALLQYFLQTKLNQKKSITKFVIQSLSFQVISLLGLAIFSFYKVENIFNFLIEIKEEFTFVFLFILYTLYWLGHYCIQPAWNKWIADIIPINEGPSYFSMRTRLSQIGILIGLFLGGYLLHLNRKIEVSLLYGYLFVGCLLLKLIIIELFKKHPLQFQPLHLNLRHFKKLFLENKSFFYRYAFFNLTLFLSAPYVAGYLLSTRGLNYQNFMWVMSGLFIGKMISTYLIKFISAHIDLYKLMMIGVFIAAPLPAFWPYCESVTTMALLHMLSGMGWAGWEVGLSLNFFKKFQGERKIEIVSLYNYFGVITQVVGTLIGSFVFIAVLNKNFDQLFIVAGAIRMFAVFVLAQVNFGYEKNL